LGRKGGTLRARGFSPFQIMDLAMKGGSGVSARTLNGCEDNLRRTRLPCCSASAVSSSSPWIFSSAGSEDRRIRPQFYRASAVTTNSEMALLERRGRRRHTSPRSRPLVCALEEFRQFRLARRLLSGRPRVEEPFAKRQQGQKTCEQEHESLGLGIR